MSFFGNVSSDISPVLWSHAHVITFSIYSLLSPLLPFADEGITAKIDFVTIPNIFASRFWQPSQNNFFYNYRLCGDIHQTAFLIDTKKVVSSILCIW
jgi:hypothetical protein